MIERTCANQSENNGLCTTRECASYGMLCPALSHKAEISVADCMYGIKMHIQNGEKP